MASGGGRNAAAAVAAGPQRSQSTVDINSPKKSMAVALFSASAKDTSFAIDTMGEERATCPHCLQDMEARKLKV